MKSKAGTKIMSLRFRKKYLRISFTTHLASQSKTTQMRLTKLQIDEKEGISLYLKACVRFCNH